MKKKMTCPHIEINSVLEIILVCAQFSTKLAHGTT